MAIASIANRYFRDGWRSCSLLIGADQSNAAEETVNSTVDEKLWQKLWRRRRERAAVPTVVEHYDAARYPLLAGELMQAKIVLASRIAPSVIAAPYKR